MATAEAFPAPAPANTALVNWPEVLDFPCRVTAELTVVGFTVGDLLRLEAGSVVDSKAAIHDNVSLHANGTRIGWGEFEVQGDRLAVRPTELE